MSALATGVNVQVPHHVAAARTAATALMLAALCVLSLAAVFLSTSVGSVAGADGLLGAFGGTQTHTIEGSFHPGSAANYASRDERRVAPVTRQRPEPLDVVVIPAR